mmetsp:Transcript_22487/g.59350  ORF Transcript_22487/g.59350 Transcript_22487/m.59350 type:complete len:85 (-) Transcript_22487:146-400(-)
MLRQAARLGARQAAVATRRPVAPQARSFGAVGPHHGEKAIARPFQGASLSEPEMQYIETPSMGYMAVLMSSPFVISFWFLTKFV